MRDGLAGIARVKAGDASSGTEIPPAHVAETNLGERKGAAWALVVPIRMCLRADGAMLIARQDVVAAR